MLSGDWLHLTFRCQAAYAPVSLGVWHTGCSLTRSRDTGLLTVPPHTANALKVNIN